MGVRPGRATVAARAAVLAAVFELPIEALGFAPPHPLAAAADTELGAAATGPADALELVARLTRSDVSESTLDLLARRVDRLGRDYPKRPAPELLGEARDWLDRTLGLLEQRTSLHAHRELLVSAGWLSALVACLYYDTGDGVGRRDVARGDQHAGRRIRTCRDHGVVE